MNDLTKLKEILDNQAERGIDSGDWVECAYEESTGEGGLLRLSLDALQVAFVFSPRGRFIGIYNWKE